MEAFAPNQSALSLAALGLDPHPAALITAVKAGLPAKAFSALATALGVSEAALAEVTGISITTLSRRKRSGHLNPGESEHVVRVALLLERATEVFGRLADAREWLTSPNMSLGGATPLIYADTEIGAREVEDLLGRIAYGVYS